ncbi:MAG: hypothetical protein ABIL25_09345 [candidate division WOR-3 bacterium]
MPTIERIAPGVFGAVFYRSNNYGIAYFNRSDWTGIGEPEPGMPVLGRRPAAIVRNTIELKGTKSGVLLDATGRKVADLSPGRNELGHVAPGVYFITSTDGGEVRQKVVLTE